MAATARGPCNRNAPAAFLRVMLCGASKAQIKRAMSGSAVITVAVPSS
jgi:hypothetical protein